MQKKSGLEKKLGELTELESEYKTLSELYEIAPDDADVLEAIEKLGDTAHRAKFITLFREPADNNGAFLFIQAGAGGTEAQDWAQMLSRMYARWAERHGFTTEVIEAVPYVLKHSLFVFNRNRENERTESYAL